MKNARALMMGVLLVAYCIFFVYYLSNFEHPLVSFHVIKGSIYIAFAVVMLATWVDEIIGYTSYIHQYVNWLNKLTLSVSFILIALYHFDIISETIDEFYIFIAAMVVYTIILLYKCYKKGLFSKAQV